MKKNIELPETLTVKDVKTYLNVSQNTAYRLFKDKNFPSFSVGGSKRVTKADFLNWLEQQKIAK